MKRFLMGLMVGALALAGQVSQAQTALTAGDLAIVGYATDSTDGAWVVNLIPIEAGTSINLTQNACQSDGSFSTSEDSNNSTYNFASATPAGTITSIPWAGMSDGGDQVFIYQGTLSQANLICALSSSPWITSGSTTANTSYRPSGLTEGTHYAAFTTEVDNGYVTDLTGSRTQAEWLAYIHASANWTRSGPRPADGSYPSGTITITGGASQPTVAITDPATETLTVQNATASRDVVGTSANAVGLLTWSNGLTAASGTVAVDATWTVSAIALDVGANLITVTATNAAGTAASDTVTITRQAALSPSLTVTVPVGKNATVAYATDSYELTGTGANLAGSITWSNALTATTGTLAAGDSWSFTAGLDVGVNTITVSGTNVNGVAASDSATITRQEPPAAVLAITNPAITTLGVPNGVAATSVAGTSAEAVGWLVWSNSLTHAFGTVAADVSWSVSDIALDVGVNAITVTGSNIVGVLSRAAVAIVRPAANPAFTPGNVVVYRTGDGANAISSAAAPVFLDEYTPAGVLVQSRLMPTLSDGANRQLVASGQATSEGLLTRSVDGRHLVLTGYGTNLAVASIANTTVAAVPRVVGLAAADGTVDTSTALSDWADQNNPRSALSTDGNDLWLGGAAGGVRYATKSATTSTQLSTDQANIRQVNVFGGQLHFTTSSGSSYRLGTVGSGMPTSAGQSMANLPGFPTSGSPYAFFMADLNTDGTVDTVYVADDGAGLQKHSLVSGNWTLTSTVGVNEDDYRGVTGYVSGTNAVLFATRKGGSSSSGGGELVTITDESGYAGAFSGTPTLLASAITGTGANTAFRGVALAPEAGTPAAPVIDVLTAPATVPYATTTCTVTGMAANVVGTMSWSNALNAANGTFAAAADWSVSGIPLAVGANAITVSGTNSVGTAASDDVTITREAATPATVTITAPGDDTVVVLHATEILDELSGSTANAVGLMTISNKLGAWSATVSATASWSYEEVGIPLQVGVNEITVTVSNEAGVAAFDKVTVIRQALPATGTTIRLASFSDPHYFATNLLINDGPAFQTYLAQDRKLIKESAAITKAVVDQIIAQNANYVLVCGDLTKDGERASHVAFSNELARIEAAGARVLVIPGNHDIDNPTAAAYDGATETPVPSVTPAEFKAIYAPFGYDLASATDPDSVGYAADLSSTLRMVCMDSTQYGNRTYGSFTNGNRLAWITNQLTVAQAAGKLTVGMMHHGLMEHFQGQKQLFSEYVIDDYQTLAPLFAGLGLKAVFTGHFHANDIVAGTFGGRTIYDIETGSTVTWPCPYRVMELDAQGALAIQTRAIESIDNDLGVAPDFQTYAYNYLANGMVPLSAGLLYQTFGPYGLSWDKAVEVAPAAAEAMVAHYAGDEVFAHATPATQGKILELMYSTVPGYAPLYQQIGYGLASLLTDLPPTPDNNTTLDLDPPAAVSVTAPVNGAVLLLTAAVNLTAAASDERQVTNVTFLVDDAVVAHDASAPYEVSWTPLAAGSRALKAVAFDNAGQVATSAVVNVTVSPIVIDSPASGASFNHGTSQLAVSIRSDGIVGTFTFQNATLGVSSNVPAPAGVAYLPLAYGLNVLTVSGSNAMGVVYSQTVTVTREAPTPANGTDVTPGWDYLTATGAVRVAWTTNDWYQFQSTNVCLPGMFLFRDPFGGSLEPGSGDPEAVTANGLTHYRYDAAPTNEYIVIEGAPDFSIRVPCYDSAQTGVAMSQEVWLQVKYWDDPNNTEWVQGWELGVTAQGTGAGATTPLLMGRVHGADGLITEAFAFTVTGDASGFTVGFAADPALSFLNPAYVDEIVVDVQTHAPLLVQSPTHGSVVSAETASVTPGIATEGLVGDVVCRNATLGVQVLAGAPLPLAYGLNTLVVSGSNGLGQVYSHTIEITRLAPTPVNGGDVLPEWDYELDDGSVHVAWTTNDWYQFQATNVCLPGTFQYRDPAGGELEPGDGEPEARTAGATHFRYDSDGTRCIVVEDAADFRVRVPCYSAATLSAPRSNDVWVQVAYWDAPGNPEWVQDWQLTVTPDGGSASDPVLMGRVHGADGLITEAYAFTLVGDDTDFEVAFAADPALSAATPGFISAVTVDTRVRVPLAIANPAADGAVASETDRTVVTAKPDGLVGSLTFRNTSTGQEIVASEGDRNAELNLAYGDNVIIVSGTDAEGRKVTATVTVTRPAPTPAQGTDVLPNWDDENGTGTVHVAWTTNDWYQFQSDDTCLPGTFRFQDPFGGTLIEPGEGDGAAYATKQGTTHFRYDSDGTRCIAIEGDDDFAVRVPCYASASTGLPMNQSVWLRISFWDAPGNSGWVPGWQLTVTAEGPAGVGATAPVLMGREHGADGRITEAYAFHVTGDATAFEVSFAGDPAFSLLNAVHVSDVVADVLSETAVPAYRILTAISGNGTVSRENILLAHGASTNLVIEAAEWHRIAAFTTNDMDVAAVVGARCYTQQFETVTQDYANSVTFGPRPNSLNPDSVPTVWLAGFGKDEANPLVSSDRSIREKYLLDVDPYAVHAVLFDIAAFGVDGDFADVTVKLLVNGEKHDHINGYLQLDGRMTLGADWDPVDGTPITGNVFENGIHAYRIETDTNRFFRAVVR
jgi:hypothetical protein